MNSRELKLMHIDTPRISREDFDWLTQQLKSAWDRERKLIQAIEYAVTAKDDKDYKPFVLEQTLKEWIQEKDRA